MNLTAVLRMKLPLYGSASAIFSKYMDDPQDASDTERLACKLDSFLYKISITQLHE